MHDQDRSVRGWCRYLWGYCPKRFPDRERHRFRWLSLGSRPSGELCQGEKDLAVGVADIQVKQGDFVGQSTARADNEARQSEWTELADLAQRKWDEQLFRIVFGKAYEGLQCPVHD